MFTELSDNFDRKRLRGWLLYDAECSFCRRVLARVEPVIQAAGFQPSPLQSLWVKERLNLPEHQLLAEMRVLTREGRILGGADALYYLAGAMDATRRPLWAWFLVIAGKMPFARPLGRWAYRWVAARRYCRQSACRLPDSVISKEVQP